jgi:mannose-6-phosphate isomerase-like protein (cupin superfamily)
MADGTYKFDATILITETNCGSEGNYKILRAADNANVVLDFSSMVEDPNNRGVVLDGDYWYVNGITFYGAGDNGMLLSGNNNIIEGCVFEANHDTGLQLSRFNKVYSEVSQWPSNNLILNCTSFDNCDLKSKENADGFAAKLTCGEGNVFDGCISYANSDDGWDLFAKKETGPIGVVTIRNCVAFANGKTTSGTSFGSGDMNGFKLGGSGVGTAHYVFNCLAFNNGATGFTDNNNPSNLTIMNCTAASNGGGESKANFVCYRSASGAVYKNLVSYNNTASDKFTGVLASSIVISDKKNYIFSTSLGVAVSNSSKLKSLASSAYTLSPSSFKNANNNISVNQDIDSLFRNADGTINVNGLYETEATSDISSLGAHFNVASQKIALLSSSSTEPATEENTEASTEESTEAPTEASTEESTEAPTEESTEASTEESTETPTEATEASTEESTETPTEATEASTEESTEASTEESTEAPTQSQEETSTEVAADTDTVYEMLEGDGVTVTGTEKLVLRSSASFDLFLGVKVDGVLIDPSNYVAYSGSTIVEISADYMASLSAGVHEFIILSKDGSASTNVTITANAAGEVAADTDVVTANDEIVLADTTVTTTNNSANTTVTTTNNSADTTATSTSQTGDTANVIPYIILLVIAGVAIAVGVVVSIKKKHN